VCCNPRHLIEGSHVENMADMVQKKRQAHGEVLARDKRGALNPSAKLSDAKVEAIRRARRQGIGRATLARRYNVSGSTISRVANGGWSGAANEAPTAAMSAVEAQALGAAARRRRTVKETLPRVVADIRRLLRAGVKPTSRACGRLVPGYWAARGHASHSELLAMVRK
jgi:transcriptional regulator with XRE-family HTH domain